MRRMNRIICLATVLGLALALPPLAPAPPARAAPQPYTLVLLPGINPDQGKLCLSSTETCDGQRSRSLTTFEPLLSQLPRGSYGDILEYNYSPAWATEAVYYSNQTRQSIAISADLLTGQLQQHLRTRPGARFVLVGHSLGGAIATYWAAVAPPDLIYTVHSIVALDSPLGGISSLAAGLAELLRYCANCPIIEDLRSQGVKERLALGVSRIDTVNLWNTNDYLAPFVARQPQNQAEWRYEEARLGCYRDDDKCHSTIIRSSWTAERVGWALAASPPRWTARQDIYARSGAALVGPSSLALGAATEVKITVRGGPLGVPVIGRGVALASSRNQAGAVDAIAPSPATVLPLSWCRCWGTGGPDYGGFAPGEAVFAVTSSTPGVALLQAYDVTGGMVPLGSPITVTFGQAPPTASPPGGGAHVRYAGGEGAIPGADFAFSVGQRADGTREGWWVQSGGSGGNWVSSAIASIEAQGGVASVWGFGHAPGGAKISFNLVVRPGYYEMRAWTVQGAPVGASAGELVGGGIRVVAP